MEEIVKSVIDNGLGVGSFISLLYFIFKYEDKQSTTLNKISDTLIQVQITLSSLSNRTDKLENNITKKDNE